MSRHGSSGSLHGKGKSRQAVDSWEDVTDAGYSRNRMNSSGHNTARPHSTTSLSSSQSSHSRRPVRPPPPLAAFAQHSPQAQKVLSPSQDRWSQYDQDPDSLRKESQVALATAVASAAERAALNESLEEPDDERILRMTTSTRPALSLEISDTYDEDEGIDLAPVRPGRRLVGSLSGRPKPGYSRPAPPHPKPSSGGSHDKVRMEALKMLQLADEKTSPANPYALRKTQSGGWTSSSRNAVVPKSQSSNLAGLDMALGARETKDRYRVSPISNDDDMEEVDEDDSDDDELTRRQQKLRTTIQQQHRDPVMDEILIEEEESTKPSNWSSRYSVDHHLMAITGGANAAEMLNKMDRAHYSSKKSANNMFKTSPHESGGGLPSFRFGTGSGSFAANGIPSMGWRSDDANNGRRTSFLKGLFSGWGLSSLRRKKQFTPKGSGGQTIWTDVDMRLAGPRTVVEEEKYRRRLQRMVLSVVCLCLMIVALVVVYSTVDVHGRGSGIVQPEWAKVGSPVTFYVTANVPFNEFDAKVLTRSLTSLATGTDFVVHLGDVHNVANTECTEDVYQEAGTIFKESRAPVFVLPGNNDWNDCRDPKSAWKNWNTYLNRFEDNFNHNFKVDRQLGRTENFAFLHQGVLFIGLHLVDGTVVNQADETIRHAQDVAWTEQKLHAYNVNDFRAVVLMGHSKPNAQVSGFFSQVVDELAATGKPTIYMYAARTVAQTFIEYKPFVSAPQMMAARIEEGGSNGPTKVTIGFGTDPFFFAEQTSS